MAKITDNVVVNAAGGALVSIPATIFSLQVLIMEDPNNAPAGVLQGLIYFLPDEGFAIAHKLAAGEVLTLGNTVSQGAGLGRILGGPAQNTGQFNAIPATVYAKVTSLTANATAVRVQEMD